jgi:hypothetical protein
MAYKKVNFNGVLSAIRRLADGASIPINPDNRDYAEYLKWVTDGGVPEEADPPPPPSQDELDAEAARTYAKLVAIRDMTPAEVQTWIDANLTDLATAKDVIKTLAVGFCVLARRI